MTVRYVLALAAIAALSVGAHAMLQAAVSTQEGGAAEINVSGRQRMRSQRIALHTQLLASRADTDHAALRADLAALVADMETAHRALIDGNAELGIPTTAPPAVQELMHGERNLDGQVRRYLAAARRVLALPQTALRPDEPSVQLVEQLAMGTGDDDLLPSLDVVVRAYQDNADDDVRSVETIARLMLFVTLAVLVLEARYVFRPVVRQIEENSNAVERAHRRLRAILDNALVAVVTMTDSGTIVDVNRRAAKMFGHDSPLTGQHCNVLTGGHDARAVLRELLSEAVDGGEVTREVRLLGRHPFTARVSARATTETDGTLISMVVTDISEQRDAEARLRHLALHDPLTGLANRTLFADRVDHALAGVTRSGLAVSVLFIDLDDFKTINDSLGHQAGDAMLKAIGDRIATSVRPDDTAARLGGDEFAVLIEDLPALDAVRSVAERIRQMLAMPMTIEGQDLVVAASIGVATSAVGSTADDLLRDADTAMYEAKRSGKNSTRYFTSAMHHSAVARLGLRSDLARAIDDDELDVHYQPIVDLESGSVRGVEALLRWVHPTTGPIPPSEFVPVAEDSGLIADLGRYVLRHAINDASAWRDEHGDEVAPGYVSVNVSVLQLGPTFADEVQELLGDLLPPDRLVLEVTESALMQDHSGAADVLAALRASGVRVAIDDFGTGYSSMAYLQQLPVDILKIDRSFVNRMGSEAGTALARSMIDVAHSLRLTAIAEGVETATQRDALIELHCTVAQGYLFARPMTPSDLRAYLLNNAAAMSTAADLV